MGLNYRGGIKMKMSTPLLLVTLLFITSCVPMIKTSGVTYVDDTKDIFTKGDEHVLVLPTWVNYSTLAAKRQQNKRYSFGDPIFLTASELRDLSNLIPNKSTVALMGIANTFGRVVFIKNIIIISETGKVVTIFCPDSLEKVRCNRHEEFCLNEKWVTSLIQFFEDPYGERIDPFEYNTQQYYLKYLLSEDFRISNSSREKRMIVDFLRNIKLSCD